MARVNLSTASEARNALGLIDQVKARVQKELGSVGALESRLFSGLQNLQSAREYFSASADRITDTDIAMESANLTRSNILAQASTAVLEQANHRKLLCLC